jgi:hypothetical protein
MFNLCNLNQLHIEANVTTNASFLLLQETRQRQGRFIIQVIFGKIIQRFL